MSEMTEIIIFFFVMPTIQILLGHIAGYMYMSYNLLENI